MLYQLISWYYINKSKKYKAEDVDGKVLLYRHGDLVRAFKSWEECYRFLKLINYMELL